MSDKEGKFTTVLSNVLSFLFFFPIVATHVLLVVVLALFLLYLIFRILSFVFTVLFELLSFVLQYIGFF